MTRRIGNTVILESTVDAKCDLCGKVAELRPYGPHGENICHGCGMANEPTTRAALAKLFDDSPEVKLS